MSIGNDENNMFPFFLCLFIPCKIELLFNVHIKIKTETMNRIALARSNNFLLNLNEIPRVPTSQEMNMEVGIPSCQTNVVPYFHLPISNPQHPLKIHFYNDSMGACCRLTIDYWQLKRYLPLQQWLPEELCMKIQEFSSNHLHLQFNIYFPTDYPFSPPLWALESIESTLPHASEEYGGMTLKDYYTYLVDIHNEHYRQPPRNGFRLWYPMITVEKDVLLFLHRLSF